MEIIKSRVEKLKRLVKKKNKVTICEAIWEIASWCCRKILLVRVESVRLESLAARRRAMILFTYKQK